MSEVTKLMMWVTSSSEPEMGIARILICNFAPLPITKSTFVAEDIINLPHDPVGPLYRSRNHSLSSRTCAIVEQVLRAFQVPRYQDSGHDCQHALAAFVHAPTFVYVRAT